MNKTTHYQLNQWEPTDQVRRTDFNTDNAKIDAALAANPYVKLLELTTTTAQSQINLDVSQFDLTRFHKLEIYIAGNGEQSSGTVYLRLNGLTGCYSCQASALSSPSKNETNMLSLSVGAVGGAAVTLYFFGKQILASTTYAGSSGNNAYLLCQLSGTLPSSSLETENLRTINLRTDTSIQPGVKVAVFGFKK